MRSNNYLLYIFTHTSQLCKQIMKFTRIVTVLIIALNLTAGDKPCSPRKYQYDSVVCVCNATYCDEVSKIQKLPPGKYVKYTSDVAGLRFNRTEGSVSKTPKATVISTDLFGLFNSFWQLLSQQVPVTLKVVRNKTFQKIFGFGGGFTDSSGMNMKNISAKSYNHVLRSYFSEDGIELNIGRIPIGGTDFSTHPYAYNMLPENDYKLSNFSLAMEDYKYKIPIIKDAQKMATDDIYLIAATWSPPIWMKTVNTWIKFGHLKPQYYQTYADYHIRFLEEYDKMGLQFWAISTTNEPTNGNYLHLPVNNVGWLPHNQAEWLERNFYPVLNASKFRDLKIITFDDTTLLMSAWLPIFSSNEVAWSYVDGIGVHYYIDDTVPDIVVKNLHKFYPDKFLMNTESTAGDSIYDFSEKPALGKWSKAEYLIKKMTRYFNNWSTGWIDWNFLLNMNSGPVWSEEQPKIDCFMFADSEKDEVLKQPAFYAFGHFSKFVPRGSVRIQLNIARGEIYSTAFLRPDNGTAIILFNKHEYEKQVTIAEDEFGYIELTMSPRSIHTILYWKD